LTPESASASLGLKAFNIDRPPARRTVIGDDLAVGRADRWTSADGQSLPVTGRRNSAGLWVGILSFAFNALAVSALAGPALIILAEAAYKSGDGVALPRTVLNDGAAASRSARLIIISQKGFADEPIPLGIWVREGSGEETVTLSGLADGIELSSGTSQGVEGWLIPFRDLETTYVGSSKNSSQTIVATVSLHSASGRLLDRQPIRFEWMERSHADWQFQIVPPIANATEPPLDPVRVTTLLKLGETFRKRGDIAAARLSLGQAAVAGNAQAALELAKTFDQFFLSQWRAIATVSDAAKAREWYERAAKLGSAEASSHLERLASRSN
jgi:hypothetical protein